MAELDSLIEDVRKAADARDGTRANNDVLVEKIKKLYIAAEDPGEYVQTLRNNPWTNVTILIALESGIIGQLAAAKGKPLTAAELSKRTKYDEFLIYRVMRLLVSSGIGDEVAPKTFIANDILVELSKPRQISGMHCILGLSFPVGAKILDYMRNSEFHQFPDSPEQKDLHNYVFGMPIWEVMAKNPEAKQTYDVFMAGRREIAPSFWFDTYPVEAWSTGLKQDENAALLVDIGGNTGHDIGAFKKKFPNLPGRCVLQDLPETLGIIKSLPDGVETIEYNFFGSANPVKGARIYYMRNITHDWSDKNCKAFLKNTVDAMDASYSRLLVDDWALEETNTPHLAAVEDIMMMAVASGKERTVAEFKELFDSVGLELVKIWRPADNRQAVLEAKKKAA